MLASKEIKEKKYKTVSSKSLKTKSPIPSVNHPLAQAIMNRFDDELKQEFATFLQERAKVIPIRKDDKINKKTKKSDKEEEKKEYKKEGKEPISFRELTSFKNPLFSAPGKYSPAEVNPETIDVDTFTLMRRNYQLAIGLAMIKLPIISLPWRIECDNPKIEKTVEWMLNKIWKKLIKTSLMAVDYGFASHEKVWERKNVKISKIDKDEKETIFYQGDLVYFKKIKPHHPESIKMRFDDKQNLIEIIQEGSLSEEITLPIRKCFLFTNDEEYGNPFGVSRLKNAYTVWYYQSLLIQFMMQYFERRGIPPTVATAPPGRSQDSSGTEIDNLELALRAATSLISSSVAVLPYQQSKDGRENTWKLEAFKDDARAVMFVEALSHLEAKCLRALYIPEGLISSTEKGGSGSNSVSADLFLMAQKSLMTDLEDAVNEQIIKPFVEANFSEKEIHDANIKLDQLSFERKITIKEIFVEMLRNVDSMIQTGIPTKIVPSLEKMAQILEVPVESFEDMTGFTQSQFQDMLIEMKNPFGNSGEIPGGESGKEKGNKPNPSGKKPVRSTATNQGLVRKHPDPTSKRSERKRNPTTRTKENG
jgi:hypothetical protein